MGTDNIRITKGRSSLYRYNWKLNLVPFSRVIMSHNGESLLEKLIEPIKNRKQKVRELLIVTHTHKVAQKMVKDVCLHSFTKHCLNDQHVPEHWPTETV